MAPAASLRPVDSSRHRLITWTSNKRSDIFQFNMDEQDRQDILNYITQTDAKKIKITPKAHQ